MHLHSGYNCTYRKVTYLFLWNGSMNVSFELMGAVHCRGQIVLISC